MSIHAVPTVIKFIFRQFEIEEQSNSVGDKAMQYEWSSWSGNIRFTPARIEEPENEEQVIALVQQAIAENRHIRTVGSSHSCSSIFKTDDILVSTEKLQGVDATRRLKPQPSKQERKFIDQQEPNYSKSSRVGD